MGKIDLLCLQRIFGTTPVPEYYPAASVKSIDLGNELLIYTPWIVMDLQLPQRCLIPSEEYLPESTPLVHAVTMTV